MNWLQIFNEIFDILWLGALLAFLILIWRSSERRAKQAESLQHALVDVAEKNAESVRLSVENTRQSIAFALNEQAKKQQ